MRDVNVRQDDRDVSVEGGVDRRRGPRSAGRVVLGLLMAVGLFLTLTWLSSREPERLDLVGAIILAAVAGAAVHLASRWPQVGLVAGIGMLGLIVIGLGVDRLWNPAVLSRPDMTLLLDGARNPVALATAACLVGAGLAGSRWERGREGRTSSGDTPSP